MSNLAWITIGRFRSVKPQTTLHFNTRYNILLGRNGTGKTTLLNLISCALRQDFSEIAGEEFDISYETTHQETVFTVHTQNKTETSQTDKLIHELLTTSAPSNSGLFPDGTQTSTPSTQITISNDKIGPPITIYIDGSTGTLRVAQQNTPDTSVPMDNTGPHQIWRHFIRGIYSWLEANKLQSTHITSLILSVLGDYQATRFDESLSYHHNFCHPQIRITRKPDNTIEATSLNVPAEIQLAIRSTMANQWAKELYTFKISPIPFLDRFSETVGFEATEVFFELEELKRKDGIVGEKAGRLRYLFSHPNGWKLSDPYLSYGQKRMLAFAYYVACNDSVIIADELVNGLHHQWIDACMNTIGNRQAFLSSQNPLLLDHLEFTPPQDVRSTFVLCQWAETPAELMSWNNMSDDVANDLFESLSVGFQHVGELLRDKNLW